MDCYKGDTEHLSGTFQCWRRVIVYHEKRFFLDGPDGFALQWHDLRSQTKFFSKHQQGGQSIMVWASLAYGGLSNICLISYNMDSAMYCDILSTQMLRFANEQAGDTFIFQKDGATVHRSNFTSDWLDANYVYLLPWPAKSPDLNKIDNLLAILARQVIRTSESFKKWNISWLQSWKNVIT